MATIGDWPHYRVTTGYCEYCSAVLYDYEPHDCPRLAALGIKQPQKPTETYHLTLTNTHISALISCVVQAITGGERLGLNMSVEQEVLPMLKRVWGPQARKSIVEVTIVPDAAAAQSVPGCG